MKRSKCRADGDAMTAVRSVLMFCSQFRPIVGGAERQAEKLSKALVRKGLRVKVLTPRWGPDAPVHEIDCGVEIHRFPFFDLAKAIPIHGIGPLNLLSARHQTMQALWRNLGDAQIVHAHIASAFSLFAMQAAQCRAVPFLCKAAVGGGKSDLSELSEGSASGPLLARRFARDLTCWIAITDAVRDSLLK